MFSGYGCNRSPDSAPRSETPGGYVGRLFSNLGSGVLEQWSAEKFGRPFRAIHEGGLPRPEGPGYYLLPLRGKLP